MLNKAKFSALVKDAVKFTFTTMGRFHKTKCIFMFIEIQLMGFCKTRSTIKVLNLKDKIFPTIQNAPSVMIGFMTLLCHYLCEMGYFL